MPAAVLLAPSAVHSASPRLHAVFRRRPVGSPRWFSRHASMFIDAGCRGFSPNIRHASVRLFRRQSPVAVCYRRVSRRISSPRHYAVHLLITMRQMIIRGGYARRDPAAVNSRRAGAVCAPSRAMPLQQRCRVYVFSVARYFIAFAHGEIYRHSQRNRHGSRLSPR